MEVVLPPYTSLVRNYFSKKTSKQTLQRKLIKIFNDVYSIKDHFQISIIDYNFNALNNPQFLQPNSTTIDILKNIDLEQFHSLRSKLPSNIVINPWIITLYVLAGNTTKSLNIGPFMIFSFSQFVDRIEQYLKRNPQITWTDLGHKYMGMGHVQVLRMDIENGELFIQSDGGSSELDREYYWNEYKNQKITSDQHISFLDFVQNLKTNIEY